VELLLRALQHLGSSSKTACFSCGNPPFLNLKQFTNEDFFMIPGNCQTPGVLQQSRKEQLLRRPSRVLAEILAIKMHAGLASARKKRLKSPSSLFQASAKIRLHSPSETFRAGRVRQKLQNCHAVFMLHS
jgi:hypothetical protein